jgi:RNA polymerase sigma-70 factor (ECF subfamily)
MEMPPDTNDSLIARVKDPADEAAWVEFLAIYQPVVQRMARNRGLQAADADDLAQTVFLLLSSAINDWTPKPEGPPFRAWLFTITRNAIINALKSRQRHQAEGGTTVLELLDQVPDQASSAEFYRESQREVFRWVCAEVRPEFSPATWNIFWRTAVEETPAEQVAAEMNRKVGAIYVAKWRVLKRIKERVADCTFGWEPSQPPQQTPRRERTLDEA